MKGFCDRDLAIAVERRYQRSPNKVAEPLSQERFDALFTFIGPKYTRKKVVFSEICPA
jgi:hypothetical protein